MSTPTPLTLDWLNAATADNTGDEFGSKKDDKANADHLSGRDGDGDRDLEKMIEVWEVYFVREKVVAPRPIQR